MDTLIPFMEKKKPFQNTKNEITYNFDMQHEMRLSACIYKFITKQKCFVLTNMKPVLGETIWMFFLLFVMHHVKFNVLLNLLAPCVSLIKRVALYICARSDHIFCRFDCLGSIRYYKNKSNKHVQHLQY